MKKFQADFEAFHLHLNPWAFVDPVSVGLLDLVVTWNGRSHDFVDPRLLNLHLRSGLPDSSVFLEEVQHVVVVVGQHARMNVDILAHVI